MDRLKVTDSDEYLELIENYIDKSKEVITYRTDKIIEVLKDKLRV